MTSPNRTRQQRDPQHQAPSREETALNQGLSTQGSPTQASQQQVPSNQVRSNQVRSRPDPPEASQHQASSTSETPLTQGLPSQGFPTQAAKQRVPSNQVRSRPGPRKGVPPRRGQGGQRPPDQLLPLRDAALEIVADYLNSSEVAALAVEDVQPLGRDILIGQAVGEKGAVRLLRLTGLEAVRLWTWASAVGPGRSLFGLSASGIRQARMRRRRDA